MKEHDREFDRYNIVTVERSLSLPSYHFRFRLSSISLLKLCIANRNFIFIFPQVTVLFFDA